MAVDFETLRQIALAFPGMEEGYSYGTRAFRVRKKFFARIKEDGETLVLKVGDLEKDFLLEAEPDIYFSTDHYNGYPAVLIRLPIITPEDLRDVIEKAWRKMAARRDLAAYDTCSDS